MNKIIPILILILMFLVLIPSTVFASDPKLVTTLNKSFEKIKSWIIKIATPAAAVAVGTGIFMKKFSFGDEERLNTGKKLIKGSLFSYGFILAIDLILSAIKTLLK